MRFPDLSAKGYALIGAFLGLLLPSLDVVLILYKIGAPVSVSLTRLATQNSLSFVVGPMLLAVVGYVFGHGQNKLRHAFHTSKRTQKELHQYAYFDTLTQLGNRHALINRLGQILELSNRNHRQACLFLIDLEKFKTINELLGHHTGDAVLQAVAERLGSLVEPERNLFRLAGDQFIILWEGERSAKQREAFAAQVMRLFETPYTISGHSILLGASIAIAPLKSSDSAVSDVLRRTDLALAEAKQVSGNAIVAFRPDMMRKANERMQMERDLREALKQGQFSIVFQPIIGAKSNHLRAFESLLRWNHPQKGLIAPDVFIPIAEASGLIIPLGRWVLKRAIEAAVLWPSPISVSVNVSAEQFKDRGLADFALSCLKESGLAPGRLSLEITESVFVKDLSVVQSTLEKLSQKGVRVSLDDFGTGFSSLNHLRNLPFNTIKIDRSFTQHMLNDAREADLLRTIIRLGSAFAMSTVLEGVETDEERAFAARLGIDDFQGYFFSKPVPEAETPRLIETYFSGASSDKSAIVAA